jgi:hypothetical protein
MKRSEGVVEIIKKLLIAVFISYIINCSINGSGSTLQAESHGVDSRWGHGFFSVYLILLAAPWLRGLISL